MNPFPQVSAFALAVVLGVLGIGAAATPALGATYALNLSAPSTGIVGRPVVIQASGVKPPPEQFWYLDWIELVAIPSSVVSACPYSSQDGATVAVNGGGKIIDIALRPNSDAAGNFSNTSAVTPWAPGRLLICGYIYNEEGAPLTQPAQLTLDVSPGGTTPAAASPAGASAGPAAPTGASGGPPPASAPPATKPENLEKPHLTRSGRTLTCNPGRWANASGTYGFDWLVNGNPLKGATGGKLGVKAKLRGRRVQCRVTASSPAGAATAVSRALRVR